MYTTIVNKEDAMQMKWPCDSWHACHIPRWMLAGLQLMPTPCSGKKKSVVAWRNITQPKRKYQSSSESSKRGRKCWGNKAWSSAMIARRKGRWEDLPASTWTKGKHGDRVAFGTDLGSDSADDDTHKASDVGRSSGSRSVEDSATLVLDGATVAAIVDDRWG